MAPTARVAVESGPVRAGASGGSTGRVGRRISPWSWVRSWGAILKRASAAGRVEPGCEPASISRRRGVDHRPKGSFGGSLHGSTASPPLGGGASETL